MNAVSLYLSTCRYIMQASPENPYSWSDLYKYLPYLRQALSCCVCTHILHIPMGPIDTICQHHVCQRCIGGKMRLYPSCSWCKDYAQFQENTQLRIVIQCYKKLCQYLSHSRVANALAEADNGDKSTIMSIVQEGIVIADHYDYGANPLPLSSFYTKCQSPKRYLEFEHEAERNATASGSKEPILQPCSPVATPVYASPVSSPKKERKCSRSGKKGGTLEHNDQLGEIDSTKECDSNQNIPDPTDSERTVEIHSHIEASSSDKKTLDSGNEAQDTCSERKHASHVESRRNRHGTGGSKRTRHSSHSDQSGSETRTRSQQSLQTLAIIPKETKKVKHTYETVSNNTGSDSEKDRKEQRSRRTSTTRVSIGEGTQSHKLSKKQKTTVAEPDTSQPAPEENPPPLSPRVCLGEHDYMKESPYYSVCMPNGNEPKLTIRRKHPGSPGYTSPKKRTRIDDSDIPKLEIAAPVLDSPMVGPKTKKKRSKLDVKKKGCRCGTAAPTPGKLTCCGQRCPCYSNHKPCLDCSCRGCHNPRKLAVADSTVRCEEINEDAEIFVDV